MRKWRLQGEIRWRPFLAALAGLGAMIGLGAFLFAWSGLYSVAASRGHWAVTDWFLQFTLRNSVDTHSLAVNPPDLNDMALIRLGAGHFAFGCSVCHGAPGEPQNAVFRRMLPGPPGLTGAAHEWQPRELFWIVKNGFKFTGMPAWPAQHRDDEVWAVVAFLQVLPQLDTEQYQQLTGFDPIARQERHALRKLAICASCHGGNGELPSSDLVPLLHGQQEHYLERALREYRDGSRQSGIMQNLASVMDDAELAALSRHYAAMPVKLHAGTGEPDRVRRGRAIAKHGSPAAGVPACLACHERPGAPLFPRLTGQNARYMVGQLALWRSGLRRQSPPSQIMAVIGSRLSAEMAEDVAAYFEQRDPDGESSQ